MTLPPGLLLLALTAQGPGIRLVAAESLHVVVAGAGPAVVLLPGLFGAAYEFRKITPLLIAAGHRVIIVEPLGVGSSARPSHADYSLASQADRLGALLDTLRVGPVLVIAHSLGGAIAFRLAVRRPDLVRGLVSLEGGPTEEATTPVFRHAMRFAPLLKFFFGRQLVRSKIRGLLVASSGDPSWVTDEAVRGYTDGAVRDLGATIRAFQAMGRAREPELLAPRLPQIRCPVRLIVGGAPHDGGVGSEEVDLLRHSVRSFAVDTVPGVGHYAQEEQPAAVMKSIWRVEAAVKHQEKGEPESAAGHAHRVSR